jgi:tetratricopeptide (TPR) repeat protein
MDQAATNFADFSKTSDEYDETKASLGIIGLFGEEIKPDAAGHRAVATILYKNGLMAPAETTCRQALELCRPSDEEWYRASCVLTNILLGRKKKKEAYEVSKTATNELRANEVPPPLKRIVYTTHAKVQRKLGLLGPALESYAQAKASDPDGITPGEDLVGELKVVDKKADKTDYIQMLKSWSLLERITWLASNYLDEGEERHAMFCDIASETGEKEFIVKFYEEATNFLDNIDASPPVRLELALIYFEVCRDPEKTLETLDQLFDGHDTGYRYPIVGGNALWMMPRALGCMTNVQVELFRRSRNPVYKGERITSLSSIMQRSFVLDVPRTSASFTSSQRIALAYMYMVMGPASKFQEIIQSLLDDCFAGLADSVGWNDAPYLWTLAKTLALMSRALRNDDKLRRYARIVGSATFSQLTKEEKNESEQAGTVESGDGKEGENAREKSKSGENGEDSQGQARNETDEVEIDTSDDENELGPMPDDEGDLVDNAEDPYICGGFCYPPRSYRWWGNRSAYLYVTHVSGMICEECQAEYDAIQRGEKTFKGRYFWGIGHDKLKLPIEGWKGVKDGVLRIEGEEPIAVEAFLEKLQTEICRDAWERLWAGDAF